MTRRSPDPPAIYDEVYSIGSWRQSTNAMSTFSSRGRVTIDGSNRLKPDLVAPGQTIRSCTPTNSYANLSGTSMAGPHVCGAVALLHVGAPGIKGQVDIVETVLNDTAIRYNSASCSSNGTYPNNVFGWGRLDVAAAVAAVRGVSVTTTPLGAGRHHGDSLASDHESRLSAGYVHRRRGCFHMADVGCPRRLADRIGLPRELPGRSPCRSRCRDRPPFGASGTPP
jgi:hypothetical protein